MIEENDDDVVEEMMKNFKAEKSSSSTTTQTPVETSTPEPDTPSTTDGEVGHGGHLVGTNRHLERKVRSYAKKFIAGDTEYPSIAVDLDKVHWEVSGRMTRTLGRCFYSKPRSGHQTIKMSKPLMDKADWERVCCTIRHELVHAWQKQNDEPTGHGWSFKKWCDPLGISVRADKPASQEYKYEIHCPEHGLLGGKMKRCKHLKQIVNKNQRYCQKCGSDSKGTLFVKKDGRKLKHI